MSEPRPIRAVGHLRPSGPLVLSPAVGLSRQGMQTEHVMAQLPWWLEKVSEKRTPTHLEVEVRIKWWVRPWLPLLAVLIRHKQRCDGNLRTDPGHPGSPPTDP